MKINGMTPKQSAFVREYMLDKNATQAAIRAGYSRKTARQIGEENLSKPDIAIAISAGLEKLAKATETESDWVRRRLKEEADDHSEDSSHSARVRAIELVGRLNGDFEQDNRQQAGLLGEVPRETLKFIVDRLKAIGPVGKAG